MAFQKFLIGAPFKSGQEKNVRPWLLPEDAFERLDNAYVFRGRVRKRFGSRLLNGDVSQIEQPLHSRLRINVDTTDGAGNAAGNVPGIIFKVGQMFSIGTEIYTVVTAGAAPMLSTGAGTGTYNTGTGAYTFNGAPALTDVFFYPSEPVMGFTHFEDTNINDEPTLAYDTQFAYQYITNAWVRLTGGTDTWTGNNAQFFWSFNWHGVEFSDTLLFVTNFNVADGIRTWDGATWTTFAPTIATAPALATLNTARLIVAMRGRLIFLNTVETDGGVQRNFQQRARWSQFGDPLDANAFRVDVFGRGGFADASTQEAIVSAEFIKDRLIVFFERSTWELVATGNQVQPFVWQKINTELGVESTFSVVPFDKAALGVANVGIHACNGANVERIDEKIPDEVFEIHNGNDGVFRVHGIRDYFTELVYWTFPDAASGDGDPIFPTRVLTFNYENGTWSENKDSITAFGYFQNTTDLTWADIPQQWQVYDVPWNSGTQQSRFRQVICGNQQGWTFIADSQVDRNAPALQITNITLLALNPQDTQVTIESRDHNLSSSDFVLLETVQGITNLNGLIVQITVVDADTFTFVTDAGPVGVYTGGGTLARVTPPDILTKEFNFFTAQDKNTYLEQVKFLVDRTTHGEFTVSFFSAFSGVDLGLQGQLSGAALSNYIVETRPYTAGSIEELQSQLWHWLYLQGDSSTIQLRLHLSVEQTQILNIAHSAFQLHAMLFYAMPTRDLESGL